MSQGSSRWFRPNLMPWPAGRQHRVATHNTVSTNSCRKAAQVICHAEGTPNKGGADRKAQVRSVGPRRPPPTTSSQQPAHLAASPALTCHPPAGLSGWASGSETARHRPAAGTLPGGRQRRWRRKHGSSQARQQASASQREVCDMAKRERQLPPTAAAACYISDIIHSQQHAQTTCTLSCPALLACKPAATCNPTCSLYSLGLARSSVS